MMKKINKNKTLSNFQNKELFLYYLIIGKPFNANFLYIDSQFDQDSHQNHNETVICFIKNDVCVSLDDKM